MSTEKKHIDIVDAIKNKPVVSSLCAAYLPVAAILPADGAGVSVAAPLMYSAPAACAAMTAVGLVNMVRHKSVLSKAFSAAAIGSGGLAVAAWADGLGFPGWGEVMGYALAVAGASASGAANLGSHLTRNVGPTIGVKKPDTPSM